MYSPYMTIMWETKTPGKFLQQIPHGDIQLFSIAEYLLNNVL